MFPLITIYPFYSPYIFSGNKPIKFIDIDGLQTYNPDANRPTGITLLSDPILPTKFNIDRNHLIQTGKFSLCGVKSESGEWWLATQNKGDNYDDLTAALKAGDITPAQIPVDFVLSEGKGVILNT